MSYFNILVLGNEIAEDLRSFESKYHIGIGVSSTDDACLALDMINRIDRCNLIVVDMRLQNAVYVLVEAVKTDREVYYMGSDKMLDKLVGKSYPWDEIEAFRSWETVVREMVFEATGQYPEL